MSYFIITLFLVVMAIYFVDSNRKIKSFFTEREYNLVNRCIDLSLIKNNFVLVGKPYYQVAKNNITFCCFYGFGIFDRRSLSRVLFAQVELDYHYDGWFVIKPPLHFLDDFKLKKADIIGTTFKVGYRGDETPDTKYLQSLIEKLNGKVHHDMKIFCSGNQYCIFLNNRFPMGKKREVFVDAVENLLKEK